MAEENPLTKVKAPEGLEEDLRTKAGLNEGVDPTLPPGTKVDPVTMTAEPDELLTDREDLGTVTLTTEKAAAPDTVITPEKTDAPTVTAATAADKVTDMTAATSAGPSEGAIITDEEVVQGTVSKEAIAEAAQGEVSKEATVQYQIGELMSSIEEGKPLPAWASGAARGATALMQQRGLGASSMASAAMIQALMESGIPIAAADAKTYAQMDMQNLDNRQQAVLANAATFAAMDRANLNVRAQAQLNNAKAFLAIDLQNLTNEQKTNEINYQGALQAILTDAAAENAAQQFNAKNQIQVDQFFAEMDVQVQNANANRKAAVDQFNVSESNAMTQFTASLNDARERFNSQMQLQVDQSNAVWRRDIKTANTAIQNETNRLNAQNLLNMTTQAQNQLWQKYRDESAWIFQMSENAKQRAHQVGMLAMENDYNTSLYEKQFENESVLAIGETAIEVIWG